MTEPTETRPDRCVQSPSAAIRQHYFYPPLTSSFTSSLARNFSSQVKSAFNLDGQLPSLASHVEEQKHTILKERQELHRLEAQLEETEEAIAEKLDSTEQNAAQKK